MNPYQKVESLRSSIKKAIRVTKDEDLITKKDMYEMMLTFLDLVEVELKNATYNFNVELLDGEEFTFKNMDFDRKKLSDDLFIFQPKINNNLDSLDIESLAEELSRLIEKRMINENVLLVHPDVNVLRAKLTETDFGEFINDSMTDLSETDLMEEELDNFPNLENV